MGMVNGSLRSVAVVSMTAALAVVIGCRVDNHKTGNDEDVKIATPFGGMSVKTNENVVEGGVGLSIYPGATLYKKNERHDNGAADVNMNFGSFHLGVKALSYKTTDSPAQVMAFYRKDMARYGIVILCRNNRAVGKPDRTQSGLSCEHDGNTHMQMDDDDAKNDPAEGWLESSSAHCGDRPGRRGNEDRAHLAGPAGAAGKR